MTLERLDAEQTTRANLEACIGAAPVGVLAVDVKTGDLISVNEETRRLLDANGLPDTNLHALMSHLTYTRRDGREILFEDLPISRVLRTGETVRGDEVVFHLPNGRSVFTIINAAPIFSEEAEVTAVVVAFHDMTRFEGVERLNPQILGMVSHEMRPALTSIKDTAAAALDSSRELDAAEMRQLFKIIDEQADRLEGLFNDLLDMFQTESDTP